MTKQETIKQKLFSKTKVCALCGDAIKLYEDSNVDHILPKSKGGTNILANLQIVHKQCNTIKSSYMTKEDKIKAVEVYPHLEARINKVKEIVVQNKPYSRYSRPKLKKQQETKKKYSRTITTTYTPCSAPLELFNEFSKNGMKNLSYNRILEYFEQYKNHNGYKITIEEQ